MTAGRNHRLPRGFNAPTPLGLLMKEMFKPGLKATEVTVSAAQAWKGMNGDEKQKYIDQAKVIGEQRRSEFERLSDEKQHELVSEAKQKMESRKKRARRAEIREQHAATGYPKRAPTAYTLFTQDIFKSGAKPTDRDQLIAMMKEAAAGWKALSESNKQAYYERAKPAQDHYRQAVEEWRVVNKPLAAPKPSRRVAVKKKKSKGGIRAKKDTSVYRHFRDKKKKGEQLRQKKLLEEGTELPLPPPKKPSVKDDKGKKK
jgi:hypothetical protein